MTSTDRRHGIIARCWCGEQRAYFETASALFSSSCGGLGSLECLCGGDQCVCHNHGDAGSCPGCMDCDYDRW